MIEVEDRCDPLGSLLQPLQIGNHFIAEDLRRNFGSG
jgi:hypothetical protein